MRRALTRARPAKLRNRRAGVKRFTISWPTWQPLGRGGDRGARSVGQDSNDTELGAGKSTERIAFAAASHASYFRHQVKNRLPALRPIERPPRREGCNDRVFRERPQASRCTSPMLNEVLCDPREVEQELRSGTTPKSRLPSTARRFRIPSSTPPRARAPRARSAVAHGSTGYILASIYPPHRPVHRLALCPLTTPPSGPA